MVPMRNSYEKEYRFRVKEFDRFLIVKALEDYRHSWMVMARIAKDPRMSEVVKKAGPVPSKETVDLVLKNVDRLIAKFQRAHRGRLKAQHRQ